MINYSIVMRSVNANLFDINQAKSRIKAAVKAGQTPSSEDVALEGQRDRCFDAAYMLVYFPFLVRDALTAHCLVGRVLHDRNSDSDIRT